MKAESLILLTISFSLIFLLIQRSESKRRAIVVLSMVVVGGLIIWYVNLRALHQEALLGFVLAVIVNVLFWLLIGRYNPVGSSDNIHVLGLDD